MSIPFFNFGSNHNPCKLNLEKKITFWKAHTQFKYRRFMVRGLFIQWNRSPYTVDSPMAISDGMMSLERHAFPSSRAPLFYVSVSVYVVSTFMLN